MCKWQALWSLMFPFYIWKCRVFDLIAFVLYFWLALCLRPFGTMTNKLLLKTRYCSILMLIFETTASLFKKIWACLRYNQKRTRKSIKRAQLWIFTPHFSKFRAFRMLHPPKWYVFLEFSVNNKAFHFSKRVLRAVTACKKWLKKPCHIEKAYM